MELTVTYSPAYTLVPTYECFNRCTYCNFRRDSGTDEWMSLKVAREILEKLPRDEVIEILILSGEVHPQSARRQTWFERIYQLCELALEQGFLPHTNVGPLSYEEMAQLKQVNVSMGLMVEQVTPDLMATVHAHAPSKQPAVRLQQLAQAGKLKIPFTTGLLLGLGETVDDWKESLEAIARLHAQYDHIQEVILQPHQPGQQQIEKRSPCYGSYLATAVEIAKEILPADITIQIPPNLIRSDSALLKCISLGASDLGGIGPIDEVNPDYVHRSKENMSELLRAESVALQQRLPIYEKYDSWLPERLETVVKGWRSQFNVCVDTT